MAVRRYLRAIFHTTKYLLSAGTRRITVLAKSRKNHFAQTPADAKIKDFLDMVSPSVIQFNVDHYLCGNTYRCVWALREYPTATDEQAILRHLGEMDGVTIASTPGRSPPVRSAGSSTTPPTSTG